MVHLRRLASAPGAIDVLPAQRRGRRNLHLPHWLRKIGFGVRILLAIAAAGIALFSFFWVGTRPLRGAHAGPGQVQLTVLHWGDKNEDQIVADLIAEFESLNPDIDVVRTNTGSPAQLATKLQTMMAAGEPPDLFYLESERVADLASKQLLADVEQYIRADQAAGVTDGVDLSDYFPAVVEAFRYDGQQVGRGELVGLPKDFTTVGFYYNRDLFRRAGVPEPSPDGWTWDEFLAAARAIGRLPDCYGAEFVTWEAMVRIYLFTYGVDFASPGFREFHFDDPQVVHAIETLRSWFHDETRTLLSAKTQLETGQEPFLTGRIGMAGPFGRWKVPTYRRIDKFDWDFAPLPHVAGRPATNGVLTVAWAMSRRNQHPEQSWRLMKFLLGRAGQERVCQTGLAIPVLRSIAYSDCFTSPALKPDNDDVFLKAAEAATYIEWPADPRYRDQLKTRLEEIFKLGKPVRPALAAAQRDGQANENPSVFAEQYARVPWRGIAAGVLIPAGLVIAIAAVFWWRKRPPKLAFQEELSGLLMLSPWIIGLLAFTAFPIVLSLLLAFSRWSGMLTLDQAEWVGFDNFRELMGYDPTFRRALVVTSLYALLAVPSSQIVALGAALLLNRELRSIGVFRAIWYLPSVLAGVGMAIMWKWAFHHEHGLLKALFDPLLAPFGLHTPAWFEKNAEVWGVPAFALINLWMIGGTMMIYLAGLKGVPVELYEAAEIDGAGRQGRFLHVTLPMLSPVIFFNVIMAIIASFQIFTQVFIMTGGGPGIATHFYVFYVYKQAFDLHQMGYASAMAWLLLLIVLGLTLLVMRGSRRFVYYEALRT